MIKLIQDDDLRDENCAYRIVSKDLENGVGRVYHGDEDNGLLDVSSEFVDSDKIDDNVNPNADESELAPDLIEEDPNDMIKKAQSHRHPKKIQEFDSNQDSNSRQITEDFAESPVKRIDSQIS
jgi:hypothetical protein